MDVQLRILRFDPERDELPHWEEYAVAAEPSDRVLDLLHQVKWYQDGTLTFRRSCAHGVCGSDAMLINGRNRLACEYLVKDAGRQVSVEPVPGSKVIKDLLIDLDGFWQKYRSVMPYLVNDEVPEDGKERRQSPDEREQFEDTSKCILFGDAPPADPALVVTALRGFTAFPALMLTMERIGATSALALVRAARHAADLDAIKSDQEREASILQFQATMGIVERAQRPGILSREAVEAIVLSLTSLPVTRSEGYDTRLAAWIRSDLMPRLGKLDPDASAPAEEALLAAMAGSRRTRHDAPVIEWEGQRYSVDPPAAELRRLRRVRERQGGSTLDAALAAVLDGKPAGERGRGKNPRVLLTETLVSLLYAAHLGDPDGQALQAGDVARRHTLTTITGLTAARKSDAWMLPREQFSAKGWCVGGSLLGLETALGRLAVRRLDSSTMPLEPRLSTNERNTLMLTAALMNPAAVTDATRDEIAAAIARGRARAAALRPDREEVDRIARAAGLSEWRREALAWALTHDPSTVVSRFSILELFWLGVPRPAVRASLNDWGVAVLTLTGCLCLEMPDAIAWEERTGRPATGQLATRGADVALQVADLLASLHLPASLAPGVVAYAMQDVSDQAQPSHFDDWDDFSRAVRDLTRERLIDYISALAADGPLVPMPAPSGLP